MIMLVRNGSDDAFIDDVVRRLLGKELKVARKPRSGESKTLASLRAQNERASHLRFTPGLLMHESDAAATGRRAIDEMRQARACYTPTELEPHLHKMLSACGGTYSLPTSTKQMKTNNKLS